MSVSWLLLYLRRIMQPIHLLVASMLPLVLGPLLVQSFSRGPSARLTLQGAVGVAVAGTLLFHVLPHAYAVGGIGVGISALCGWLLSLLLHRWHGLLRAGFYWLPLCGLGLHAALDGVALFAPEAEALMTSPGQGHAGAGLLLAMAIVLHRLPLAMAIWWLGRRYLGAAGALGLLLAIALATVLGFVLAGHFLPVLSSPAIAWSQGFIAGLLVHMVSGTSSRAFEPRAWWLGVGIGVLLLAASFALHLPEMGAIWLGTALVLLVGQLGFMWSRVS